MRRVPLVGLAILSLAPILTSPAATRGQEAEPAPIVVVAGGLDDPRGFVAGEDEVFFVATAGRGGEHPGTSAAIPDAPLSGGETAGVVRVEDGCPAPFLEGVPSAVSGAGRTFGAADVAVFGDDLYVLVAGGGAAHGNPNRPNGLYRVTPDRDLELLADLSGWFRANPVAAPNPLDADPDGLPVSMTVIGEEFWIVESTGGQVLRITPDGTIGRIVDLSASRLVLTNIIPAPSGGAYVATSGVEPPLDRTGKVIEVTPEGGVIDVWVGLTAVVGLAAADDGTLYALETSTGNSIAPPYLTRGSGRVMRQTGFDTREVVVRRLDRPVAISAGTGGLLYVAVPGTGPASGAILRVDPTTGEPMTAPPAPFTGPTCDEPTG